MNTRNSDPNATRRGNTIVLVVGMLVLLVIIATSFVTRTHAGRVTAVATTKASIRDDSFQVLARQLAAEITLSLFPAAVFDAPQLGVSASSNARRMPVESSALRHGVDPTRDPTLGPGPDTLNYTADDVLRYPYNFAPYQVFPWTNPPDAGGLDDPVYLPKGPGNPNGGTGSPNLAMEGNLYGNPGFGDTRWLAALEPNRWDSTGAAGNPDGVLDAFSHWPHLSYIGRPGNGYLLCKDISDITNADPFPGGGLLMDHSIPVEQWLPIRPYNLKAFPSPLASVTGSPNYLYYNQPNAFINHWANWFDEQNRNYFRMYWNNSGLTPPGFDQSPPSNFYDLSDLNANAIPGEVGERLEDEFIRGRARWNVGRVLTDTDGDGFTDAFWFLVPGTIEGGIRQIVAARIIDNCGMLNINAATRLVATDPAAIGDPRTATIGATPADLALAGDLTDPLYSSDALSVGLLDNLAHDESSFPAAGNPFGSTTVAWNPDRWFFADDGDYAFLSQVGVENHPRFSPLPREALREARERLLYWNLAGRRPLTALEGLTPFDLADELELRMFFGNNYPWIMSRLERAMNTIQEDYGFLHSTNDQFSGAIRQESSEYLDQLFNREMMFENRHRVTAISAARNDIMPPWLWPSLFPLDLDNDQSIDAAELHQFRATTRKLDLRRPIFDSEGDVIPDVDRDGIPNAADPTLEIRPTNSPVQWDDDVNDNGIIDANDHYSLIAERVLRCLTDGTAASGNGYFGSYAGVNDFKFESLRRAAAGLAANIVQYRDEDTEQHLAEAVRVETVRLPGMGAAPVDPDTRMLGVEPQPFLTEVLVGHLYEARDIPAGYDNSSPPNPPPPRTVVHATFPHTAVVVVQIANPFDRPIDLTGFKVTVFGDSGGMFTGAANPYLMPNETRTYYSFDNTVPGASELVASLGLDTLGANLPVGWPSDRTSYSGNPDHAVELVRTIDGVEVVVDRIDRLGNTGPAPGASQPKFGDEVDGLLEPDTTPIPLPGPGATYPGNVVTTGDTNWFQWVHANRAWWNDTNINTTIDPSERNPRFIFADRAQVTDNDSFLVSGGGVSGLSLTEYFSQRDKTCLTCPSRPFTLQMLDKGARATTLGSNSIPDYPVENEGIVQVGELLNVWMFGHELDFNAGTYQKTNTTFSEFMAAPRMTGDDSRVNRLRGEPISVQAADVGAVVGAVNPPNLTDNRQAVPDLPAGLRLLEAFVCDGGAPSNQIYGMAQEFNGRGTTAMLNVNTAPAEVSRSLPHLWRLVRENVATPGDNPYVRVAEAIVHYRERANGLNPANPSATGWPGGADYSDRGDSGPAVRRERGIASIGELLLLDKDSSIALPPLEPQQNWRIDFAGQVAPAAGTGGTDLSTDVTDAYGDLDGIDDQNLADDMYLPDRVTGDAEEENLLFAGLSNLVTTRSDTFTVYFKVRSFRQNPVTLVWDATDPENIIDESRYVMLVDRSEVERPYQQPKILLLEKLPR